VTPNEPKEALRTQVYKRNRSVTFVADATRIFCNSGEENMRQLTLCIAAAAIMLAAPAGGNPWSEMAIEDLHGIHDIIRDNHPGPVDPENPHYRDWMEGGLVKAMARAKTASRYTDYIHALLFYTNGFEDGHLTIDTIIADRQVSWAGFTVGADPDGQAQVISAEPDSGVKLGDRIETCDGQSFDALMEARIDPYFVNSAVPQTRDKWLSQPFIANPDEQSTRLKTCRFSSGEVKLNWRTLGPDELGKKLGFDNSEFSLKQVAGVWFVHLPRFYFRSAEERKHLEALIDEMKVKAPELRKATLVFDVRGNGGGDSTWGDRVADTLWGETWTNRVEQGFDGSQEMRVSPANLRKWADIHEMLVRQNETGPMPYWTKVETAMQKANAAGKALADLPFPATKPTEPPPPDPVRGRVFLLTDSGCGSACLSFTDLMLHLPNVAQIGRPTGADAVYIEVNELPLPSGLTNLVYGMKVMRHPVRGNNQWYEPKYGWPGGEMTDAAIASWVKSLPPPDGSGPIIAGGPPSTAAKVATK
jgi:hypothetical protein